MDAVEAQESAATSLRRSGPVGPRRKASRVNPAPLGAAFLRIWVGQTVSTVGSTLSGVGVAVFVYIDTGSEAWLGALAALSALPFVIVGPFLRLVDRFSRRSTMIWADVFAAVGPTTALLLALTGRLEVWHLAVAGFVSGIGTAVQAPASLAAIPALVDVEALGRANGLWQLGPAIGLVAGPVVATPLVAFWGIEAILIADLATFAAGAFLTVMTPFDEVQHVEVDDDGSWRAAWAWLRRTGRPLMVLIAAMSVINLTLSFFNIALLVVATSVGGTARAGLALGAGGAAMVVGSLVASASGTSSSPVQTMVRTLMVIVLGTTIAASRPVFGLVVLGVAMALIGVPAVNAAVATVFHERVPSGMHGRVFGLRSSIGQILGPIGAVTAGFVIANLAAPSLEPTGALSGSIGQLIGTGRDRGAALVLLFVAATLVGLASWLRTSKSIAELDTPVSS